MSVSIEGMPYGTTRWTIRHIWWPFPLRYPQPDGTHKVIRGERIRVREVCERRRYVARWVVDSVLRHSTGEVLWDRAWHV